MVCRALCSSVHSNSLRCKRKPHEKISGIEYEHRTAELLHKKTLLITFHTIRHIDRGSISQTFGDSLKMPPTYVRILHILPPNPRYMANAGACRYLHAASRCGPFSIATSIIDTLGHRSDGALSWHVGYIYLLSANDGHTRPLPYNARREAVLRPSYS